MAASVQKDIIDVLIYKLNKVQEKYKTKTIKLAGDVAANKQLQKQIKSKFKSLIPKPLILHPVLQYCTDNATIRGSSHSF